MLAKQIAELARPTQVAFVGLNGAQGSGKSTMVRGIAAKLAEEHEQTCVTLSIDDFYLPRAVRLELAERVHPLCGTRGVPGTHDLPLLHRTLDALRGAHHGDNTPLPRFDKLADDREPQSRWDSFHGRPDCVLLEGWCVGVRRRYMPAWDGPINALEEEFDPDGHWYSWTLAALGNYEPFWNGMDLLISIAVPGWETVIESRLRQEQGLSSTSDRPAMDRDQIIRFVEHYERYTRALWDAMPRSADVLLRRDDDFRFTVGE